MRSEVRCANCGKIEWTDSGKVTFVPRAGGDFGGKWIHNECVEGKGVPKQAEWKRGLTEYAHLNEEIGLLEETGECTCNPNEFHRCTLCELTSAKDIRCRALMQIWGDTWAMKLHTLKKTTS